MIKLIFFTEVFCQMYMINVSDHSCGPIMGPNKFRFEGIWLMGYRGNLIPKPGEFYGFAQVILGISYKQENGIIAYLQNRFGLGSNNRGVDTPPSFSHPGASPHNFGSIR